MIGSFSLDPIIVIISSENDPIIENVSNFRLVRIIYLGTEHFAAHGGVPQRRCAKFGVIADPLRITNASPCVVWRQLFLICTPQQDQWFAENACCS